MKFLFNTKKGRTGDFGGVCFLGLIIFIICIIPVVKGKISFSTDNYEGFLSNFFNSSSKSTESSDDTEIISGNESILEINGFVLDIEKAKEMASNIKIQEANENNNSDRNEWESSKKFITPISGKSTGIKNYAYELETGLDYTREDFSFICPYTHEEVTEITKIDYDHIIPINYVDLHGGCDWSVEEKQEYAYNTNNGVCTWNSPNRAKSDKGPSEYMPEYNKEWYCYKWLEIATRYNIPLSQADYDVIVHTLGIK